MLNDFFFILSTKITFQKKKISIGKALKELNQNLKIEDYKNFFKNIIKSKLKKKDKFFFISIGIYLFIKNLKLKKKFYFLFYKNKNFFMHDKVNYENTDNIFFSNENNLLIENNNFRINHYLSDLGISKSEEISIYNNSYEKFETLKKFFLEKKKNSIYFDIYKIKNFHEYIHNQILKKITIKIKEKNVYWVNKKKKKILKKKSRFYFVLIFYLKRFFKFVNFPKKTFHIKIYLKKIKEYSLFYFASIFILLTFKEKYKYLFDFENQVLLNFKKIDINKKYVILLCLGDINSNYFFYTTKLLKKDTNNNFIIIANDPEVYRYFYLRNKIVILVQHNILLNKNIKTLFINNKKIQEDFLYFNSDSNNQIVINITEFIYYYNFFLKIFKKIKIVSIVSLTNNNLLHLAIHKASEEKNIKTFFIPTVSIANHKRSIPFDYKSEFIFSYGEQCTEVLKKNNYQGKIIEVGNIHYKKNCELKFKNKKNFFIKKIFPKNQKIKKIILFSTSGIHQNEIEIVKKLSIICKKLNFLIILKSHQDMHDNYKEFENTVIFNSAIKSEKLIKYCDIFITDYSSAGILAALERKFFLVLNYLKEDFPSNNYDKYGVAKKITNSYNLEKNLYDINSGKFEIKDYEKNYINFTKLYNKKNFSVTTSEFINNFIINS